MSGSIDLHMHSTVSDGTDAPGELLAKVAEAGISVFSITDHDAVKSAFKIKEIRKEGDPVFITGAEFSCKDEFGKYHILGYGFDPESEAINSVVDRGHGIRVKKVAARLDFLKSEFGITFPTEEIDNLFALDNPGKPHIGNLMVKYGYADSKENAISNYINKARIKNEHIRPEEAIESIAGAGGVPVLAHPFYGSGDELILGPDMEERLKRLKAFGLRGLEAFYSGFSEKLRRSALTLADKFDLYVTAGSDYHGGNKLVNLGDTGLAGEYPERLKSFLSLFGVLKKTE